VHSDPAEETVYQVVVNEEDQYSIWPEGRSIPDGWRAAGPSGDKAECLKYIDEVWTDMRPLSLRRLMADSAADA
jgi:MbtH protein